MSGADIPGFRDLSAAIFSDQRGLRTSLKFQIEQIAADLKRGGFSDGYVAHALKALIEEIKRP